MATTSKDEQFIEHDDHWSMSLQGRTVTRCFVDSAFGMELWDHDGTMTIRIEGHFVFTEQGRAQRLSPEQPTALGPALSALGKTVRSVCVHKDGYLSVHFTDGSSLSSTPDAEYEAWEIVGSGGLRAVCMPGGRVAFWHSEGAGTAS